MAAVGLPLVVPVNPEGSVLEGYIALDGGSSSCGAAPQQLWVRLSGVRCGAPSLRGCLLEADAELAGLVRGHEGAIASRLEESASPAAFFLELANLLDQIALQRPPAPAWRPSAFYTRLARELDEVGWGLVTDLAADLSSVGLRLVDRAGRRHEVRLALPAGYPAAAPALQADLPLPLELSWRPGGGAGLAHAVQQLRDALERYQLLWDDLDDLDQEAWVLEPARPTRGGTRRRLALGRHALLALVVDPARPRAPPECQLMGSDAAVEPLRTRMHASWHLWDEGRRLRLNLEAVLGQALPAREADTEADASADCAICYAYRLPPAEGAAADEQGEAPSVHCENGACSKPFHRRCLAEWLASDASSRRTFDRVFGQCPYCSAHISVQAA